MGFLIRWSIRTNSLPCGYVTFETPSQNKAAAFSHLTPAAVAPGFWPFFGDSDTRSSEAGRLATRREKEEEERCHWFVLLCPLTLGKPYQRTIFLDDPCHGHTRNALCAPMQRCREAEYCLAG